MCGSGEVVQRGAGVAWKESVLLTVMGYKAPFQPHAVSENDLRGGGGVIRSAVGSSWVWCCRGWRTLLDLKRGV